MKTPSCRAIVIADMTIREMFTCWTCVIFGWPAISTSAVCAIAALSPRKSSLMIVAAILAVPFCLYTFP